MQPTANKTLPIIIITLIIIAGGAFAYWYFFMQTPTTPQDNNTDQTQTGFQPIGRTPTGNNNQQNQPANNNPDNTVNQATSSVQVKIPTLRLLSNTPVGGYSASTTAVTTVVRWVERGRGNVYEVKEDSPDATVLSNTIVPRIYRAIWDKNMTSFIGSVLDDPATQKVATIYAQLNKNASFSTTTPVSTTNSDGLPVTPYELKGKNLPDNMITYAASPKKDKLFMVVNENGNGVGYVSNFDGRSTVRIFQTPVTQVTAEWPEENTIAVYTNPGSTQSGFIYTVNPKTGTWKKILGPATGLSAKISHDGKYAIASSVSADRSLVTNIYSLADGSSRDAVIRTLPDKCVWGNFYKNVAYCAVPSQPVDGDFLDGWYKGTASSNDKLWQVDAKTGEVTLLSSLIEHSDRLIDAYNLGVDDRDDYLFFINKNDLSLWSLDLVSEN